METFFALLALCEGNSRESVGIPLTEASDAELWYFLWSAPEQTIAQAIEKPVILKSHCALYSVTVMGTNYDNLKNVNMMFQ